MGLVGLDVLVAALLTFSWAVATMAPTPGRIAVSH